MVVTIYAHLCLHTSHAQELCTKYFKGTFEFLQIYIIYA